MNVLVTGVAGFIGSHVARKLVARGYTVDGVDDLSGGFDDNVPKSLRTFHKIDLSNSDDVDYIFKDHDYDIVFHLAAYAAEGLSHFIRKFNYNNNLIASVNLINNSVKHKIKHFVFASSMSVYGGQKPPFDESMPYQPEDPYAVAKVAVEQDLKCAHSVWGLNYTIFRPHNVAGPGQNYSDSYRNVIGIFLNQARNKRPLTIFGDGTQIRAFSDIDDIVNPIIDCIEPRYERNFPNETFNIGGDTPYTINKLAETVKNVVLACDNVKVEIEHLSPRIEVHTAFCSHDKLRKFYNYKSNKPLEQTIQEFWKWMKHSPHRPETRWDAKALEITDKLPEKWKGIMLDTTSNVRYNLVGKKAVSRTLPEM